MSLSVPYYDVAVVGGGAAGFFAALFLQILVAGRQEHSSSR